MATSPYVEEAFGILTDDDLYLDAILVKPANATDAALKVLRVWVPKYPLTKTSVLTCARQEVKSYGADGKIAHLVFDLRGTGESDGTPGDLDFNQDLAAVKAWADERFGGRVNFGFFGFPQSKSGRVFVWPIRPGTVMESYYYRAAGANLAPPTLLYLSSYGNFGRTDDMLCAAMAQAGYNVYGLDPFRYLLHASKHEPLSKEALAEDLRLLVQMLPGEPFMVAQPLAAGLALFWAAQTGKLRGTIAIGRSQSGLAPAHVFQNKNPHTFFLPRYVGKIAPRPLILVQVDGHPMGGRPEQMQALFASSKEPRRLEKTRAITPGLLQQLLSWLSLQSESEPEPESAG